ncbi:hypothetical protein [Rhodospirillaceae bacterium SYSU D60014]|uniref:hypothetical protein n=1 Tax=Virgifigura deserti TaxID=2268457 RepID=UPI0013C41705
MSDWQAITGVSTAITAVAASVAALFAGFSLWLAVRNPKPLIEARAYGKGRDLTEVELTIENRAAHFLKLAKVAVEARNDVGIARRESSHRLEGIVAAMRARRNTVEAEINRELPPRERSREFIYLVAESKGQVRLAIYTVRLTNPGRLKKSTVTVDLI